MPRPQRLRFLTGQPPAGDASTRGPLGDLGEDPLLSTAAALGLAADRVAVRRVGDRLSDQACGRSTSLRQSRIRPAQRVETVTLRRYGRFSARLGECGERIDQ
jgi:hypothetical protein